jgi:phosphohistidine phosphatase SixA
MRAVGDENPLNPEFIISKGILDPGLSLNGREYARRYGPLLRRHLNREGFNVKRALIGASFLRRTQDTARILFGRRAVPLPYFTEHGKIPENTPAASKYATPNWTRFLAHLSTLVHEGDSVVVVGHGSYLRSLWPLFTGSDRVEKPKNLDGILLDVDVERVGIHVHSFKEIPCTLRWATDNDKCDINDIQKIAVLRRKMIQKGGNGSAGMPLAYYQDGAQMRGYSGPASGPSVAPTSAWVRPPLGQSGGVRRGSRRMSQHGGKRSSRRGGFGLRAKRTSRNRLSQRGGFSPSVMGAFAANGARLLPVAAYMGYNMYSNQKKTRKARRSSR